MQEDNNDSDIFTMRRNDYSDLTIRRVAYEHTKYTLVNPILRASVEQMQSGITITRDADVVTPLFLELTFDNPHYEHNAELVKNLILQFVVDNIVIHQFPLRLLMAINEPIMCNGKMYINLCFDMFFGNINNLSASGAYIPKFKFAYHSLLDYLTNYAIITKLTYLDEPERDMIHANTRFKIYLNQCISIIDVHANKYDPHFRTREFNINGLRFCKKSKGFFIECDDISVLNNIKITINGVTLLDYDPFLINICCKKISRDVLYIPANPDASFKDRTTVSWEGNFNFENSGAVDIKLNFENPKSHVILYNLEHSTFCRPPNEPLHRDETYGLMCNIEYDLETRRETRFILFRVGNRASQEPQVRERIIPDLQPGIRVFTFSPMPDTSIPLVNVTYGDVQLSTPLFPNETVTVKDYALRMCAIELIPIASGDSYMQCELCNNVFSEISIKRWILQLRKTTCPTCRGTWSSNVVCINGVRDAPNSETVLSEAMELETQNN